MKELPKVKCKVKKSLETKEVKGCLEEKYDKSIKIIETIIEKFVRNGSFKNLQCLLKTNGFEQSTKTSGSHFHYKLNLH